MFLDMDMISTPIPREKHIYFLKDCTKYEIFFGFPVLITAQFVVTGCSDILFVF